MDKIKPGFEKKQSRREQGQVRGQILAFLNEGLSPAEICSRLAVSENTFYYHVRHLRAKGHIFPELAARRGRPAKTEEQILDQWFSIKEQSRDRKIIKFLRAILEEAHNRRIVEFEVYRNPLPHQSPLLERHPGLSGYDSVTAISAGEMRLLRALANEIEKQNAGKGLENFRETMTASPGEKESETLLAIVWALKTFDLTNLRENARRILEATGKKV
jgi:transposase